MTNFAHGRAAEAAATDYLHSRGYKIVAQNWRTRWCEIDIVAQKKRVIYFVEVKYRLDTAQGRGLDYITPKKLKQMAFAAEIWVSENAWPHDYCLGAIEVTGPDYEVGNLVEI